MNRALAVAAVTVLAAGCATYSWHRPDTPPAVAAQDETECLALARDSARDIALSAFPLLSAPYFYGPRVYGPWPYAGWGAWGWPYWGPAGDPMWRMDVEQQIHNRCMRHRGYDLHREPKA